MLQVGHVYGVEMIEHLNVLALRSDAASKGHSTRQRLALGH